MIRIHKGPIPNSLAQNATTWTEELLALLAAREEVPDQVWTRYNQPDVKQQATSDSHSKCTYCESKITHIDFGDLEHVRPKKRFPNTTHEWNNLVLACAKCNSKRETRYDENIPPVNPALEDPGTFFVAHGHFIWPAPANGPGQETIALVD